MFDTPVFYISFKKRPDLERKCKALGFRSVDHFPAVDGRKFVADQLLRDKVITIRCYRDLKYGRSEHSGIPSLGAIGCFLSHASLWNLCIERNYPYVIIIEEDIVIPDRLTRDQIDTMVAAVNSDRGVFQSSDTYMDNTPICTHFMIMSKDACVEALKHMYPIDVQVDFFLHNLHEMKLISKTCRPYFKQSGKSSIQDVCIKCNMPKNVTTYSLYVICILAVMIVCFIIGTYFRK